MKIHNLKTKWNPSQSQAYSCVQIHATYVHMSNGSKVVQFGDGFSTWKSISCKSKYGWRTTDDSILLMCAIQSMLKVLRMCLLVSPFLVVALLIFWKERKAMPVEKREKKITAYTESECVCVRVCVTHMCACTHTNENNHRASRLPIPTSMLCMNSCVCLSLYVCEYAMSCFCWCTRISCMCLSVCSLVNAWMCV